jgi:hypothetical protein
MTKGRYLSVHIKPRYKVAALLGDGGVVFSLPHVLIPLKGRGPGPPAAVIMVSLVLRCTVASATAVDAIHAAPDIQQLAMKQLRHDHRGK